MEGILEKFKRYIRIDTQSDEKSASQPSTSKQLDLLRLLLEELKNLGIDATLDGNGYLTARIPSNMNETAAHNDNSSAGNIPPIGFIAHVDTSPDAPGNGVKPQIIPNYDGKEILLKGSGAFLRPTDYPELLQYVGQTIITTDGTTLLGADDKAGIAEIMTAAEYLTEHPEFKHGDILLAFTPDEEIGRGVCKFDIATFGARYAYTMDGGALGELEFENFNAASAKIKVKGLNIHPGHAKGKMINASRVAMEFNDMLPADQKPENTALYEGFFHLTSVNGNVEEAELNYIVRDHDKEKFIRKQRLLSDCCEKLNSKYGPGTVNLELKHQYNNMREKIEPHMQIVETAEKAMKNEGIVPRIQPIRGGTDGANLSYMGLPCPNIFAGGHNFHSKMEYLPLESMEKATRVILGIISLFAQA